MTVNRQDVAAGAIFVALGLFFAISTLAELPIGTAFRMGPGYFPLVLAALLIVIGVVVAVRAIGFETPLARPAPWRGVVLLLLAPVVFGATLRGIGLIPAIVLVVLISAFASRRMTWRVALILAALLTLFCVLVFNVGLGLPIQLYGPWLGPARPWLEEITRLPGVWLNGLVELLRPLWEPVARLFE